MIKALGNPTIQKVALYGGGALMIYVLLRGFRGIGKDIGGGAVDLVGGALEGAYNALPESVQSTVENRPTTAVDGIKQGYEFYSNLPFTLGWWQKQVSSFF